MKPSTLRERSRYVSPRALARLLRYPLTLTATQQAQAVRLMLSLKWDRFES